MSQAELINPHGVLLEPIVQQLRPARKVKPIWARLIEDPADVLTMEGTVQAKVGHYLCRGPHGELWPQKRKTLFAKYQPSDEFETDGWQRFDPKPDAAPVQAAALPNAFRVQSEWGDMLGQPGDYVVRSSADTDDIWIVSRPIFEATYRFDERGQSSHSLT